MTKTLSTFDPMNTAVLFLVFNRPDTTTRVFEAIRKARPPRLFVAADGPRAAREGEAERVDEVRRIATAVDWPCEVKTLFRDRNLGCMQAVSEGINWFFNHESHGIILEDDCVPNQSFFRFCETALEHYRTDQRVWHICGNNFAASEQIFGNTDVGFSPLSQVWGWATWADRWIKAQMNPWYLSEKADFTSTNWKLTGRARQIKLNHLEVVKRRSSTWDYLWQINVLVNGGLAIYPRSNLISNVGSGEDATHTKRFDPERNHLPTRDYQPNLHNVCVENNPLLTRWLEGKMGLVSIRSLCTIKLYKALRGLKIHFKRLLRNVLLSKRYTPIVIASTGRAGSTMLTNAIRQGATDHYCNLVGAMVPTLLRKSLSLDAWRLDGASLASGCVYKSHDLPPTQICPLTTRFVFVFGDPYDSAISVQRMKEQRGIGWFYEHLYHLKGNGEFKDLFLSDCLNYREQLECWFDFQGQNVFIVRYEDIWNKQGAIEDFLGFRITLPAQVPRKPREHSGLVDENLFTDLKSLGGYTNITSSRTKNTKGS